MLIDHSQASSKKLQCWLNTAYKAYPTPINSSSQTSPVWKKRIQHVSVSWQKLLREHQTSVNHLQRGSTDQSAPNNRGMSLLT